MPRVAALLRSVNLGPNKRIAMSALRQVMEQNGYEDVTTYLQSGNVVFTRPEADPETIGEALERLITRSFGLNVRVLVREWEDLKQVVFLNPLKDVVDNPSRYVVAFLSGTPDPTILREMDTGAFAPDLLVAGRRELYLWCPNGVSESPFTQAYLEKRLKLTVTARNWNTVTRLLSILEE